MLCLPLSCQSAPFYLEVSLDRHYINNCIWLFSTFLYIYFCHLLLTAQGELERIKPDLGGPCRGGPGCRRGHPQLQAASLSADSPLAFDSLPALTAGAGSQSSASAMETQMTTQQ